MSQAITPAERSIQAGDNRSFFGHPKALGSLFFVELWERFSYYGMRAILAFYIYAAVSMGGLGFTKQTAAVIVATYGASVYLLTIIGGIVGDRLLGARRATLYGGFVIMLGHICLALPIGAASAWVGLCLVALGTGLEKPNIATLVGQLYTRDDPRRDGGFELFYMSVNIGSFFSPLIVGALKNAFGYHVGFSAAAIGMATALVIFWLTTKSLHGAGEIAPNPMPAKQRPLVAVAVVVAAVVLGGLYLLTALWRGNGAPAARINDVVFIVAILSAIYYFTSMYRHPETTAEERKHVLAYLPLFIGAVMFFMVFEQAAGYMSVFAESNTNLHLGSIKIDPEWYQSVNPLGIVVLAPLVGWFFTRRAGRFPQTPVKFAFAVLLVGISALCMMAMFAAYPGGDKLAPWWMLAAVFLLQTVGELFLSPVGLSTTTTLAPRHFASQALALWYMASAVGQALGGVIISLQGEAKPGDTTAMVNSYKIDGIMTLVIAVILFALVPLTYRLMKDVEEGRRTMHDRLKSGEFDALGSDEAAAAERAELGGATRAADDTEHTQV